MRLIGLKSYKTAFEGADVELQAHDWHRSCRAVQLWAFGRQVLAFFDDLSGSSRGQR